MSLGLDVDGVLYQCTGPLFFQWVNENDLGNWDHNAFMASGGKWTVITDMSKNYVDELYARFARENVEKLHLLMPGAQEALREMNGRTKYVATGRAPHLEAATSQSLMRDYGNFSQFIFGCLDRKHERLGAIESPNTTHFFVDNTLQECLNILEHCPGIQVILFPDRYRYTTPEVSGLIALESEGRVQKGVSDDDWDGVCQESWQEITDIILNDN